VAPASHDGHDHGGWGDPTEVSGPFTVGAGGRYELGTLLGRGGMADVYRATDTTLGREVAVKLLRDRTPDPVDRARIVDEAQTLARLNHPNLVTILDAGVSDERPFLVLELVNGTSLSVALKAAGGRGLGPERMALIGAQIAAGLAHCHAAGIVHRDVKPGNILLDDAGRALLTDFGISRLLDGAAHHTQTGFTIGTAGYFAPEQVTGDALTPAVDLYALGLVLLEGITGRREYTGTPLEAAVARLHRSPEIPADLPPALAGTLVALTRIEPALRPSAAETASALAVGRTPTVTPPDVTLDTQPSALPAVESAAASGVVPAATEPGPRRRRPTVFALLGWAAAAAAAVALLLTWHGTRPEPTTTTTRDSTVSDSKPTSPAATSPSPVRATSAANADNASAQTTRRGNVANTKPHAAKPQRARSASASHGPQHTKPEPGGKPHPTPPGKDKTSSKPRHAAGPSPKPAPEPSTEQQPDAQPSPHQ
jgi:eukaryotic-like serine/threonine-protein kinase